MAHTHSLFTFGDLLFLIAVHASPDGFEAEAYRAADGRFARVVQPDGTELSSVAPSPWQASFRMVNVLETYVLQRAQEVRNAEIPAYPFEGTWRLPG